MKKGNAGKKKKDKKAKQDTSPNSKPTCRFSPICILYVDSTVSLGGTVQHCASEANTKISGALMTAENLDTHQGSGGELNGCGLDAPITYVDRQLLICWRKTHLTHTQLETASTCLNRLILCGMVHTHRSLLLSLGTRVRDETSARGYVCNQLNLSSHATRMDLDSCSVFYVCDKNPES